MLVCIKALTTSVSKKCLSPKSTRQKNNLLHLCGLNNLGKGTNKTNFLHLCGLNNIVDKEVNIKYYFLHLCGTEFDKRNFFHFCVRQKLPLNNMRFEKTIQGNFNQADEMFGISAGKQCAANTVFSVCWTKVRNVTIWKNYDLDYILHKGDRVFKETGINRSLYINELPKLIVIENSNFDISIVSIMDGFPDTLSDGDGSRVNIDSFLDEDLFFSENVTGAIIFIDGYCVSILKEREHKKAYLFDSHSRDAEGKISGNGKSLLMKMSSPKDISEYVFETYGTHCYQLAYIRVTVKENEPDLGKCLVRFRRSKLYSDKVENNEKKEKNEKLREKRKRDRSNHSDEINEKKKKKYKDKSSMVKESRKEYYQKNSSKVKEKSKEYYQKNKDRR